MIVLPIDANVIDLVTTPDANLVFLIGKWFVFFAIGARLFVAGIRQVTGPQFTAQTIFGIKDPAAEKPVTEIGFGNLSMGLIALLTIVFPSWLVPAAIAGGLYLGLAGLKHVANAGKNRTETIAMVTDLIMFAIIVIWLILTWTGASAPAPTAA
jgi:hypothetical protein